MGLSHEKLEATTHDHYCFLIHAGVTKSRQCSAFKRPSLFVFWRKKLSCAIKRLIVPPRVRIRAEM